MSHKKFGPDRFSRFEGLLDTNKQKDKQTDRQTNRQANLYIDLTVSKEKCRYFAEKHH